MKMLCLAIAFFIIGLCVHYLFKDSYSQTIWGQVYFLWDKLKDLMMFCVPLYFITNKEIRHSLFAVITFCIVRIAWQLLVIEKDYVFASDYRVIDFMLIALLYVIASIWLYPIIRNGKKRSTTMVLKRSVRT